MKIIKSILASFALLCFLAYVLGSFYNLSFNTACWTEHSRSVIAGYLACAMTAAMIGIVIGNEQKK